MLWFGYAYSSGLACIGAGKAHPLGRIWRCVCPAGPRCYVGMAIKGLSCLDHPPSPVSTPGVYVVEVDVDDTIAEGICIAAPSEKKCECGFIDGIGSVGGGGRDASNGRAVGRGRGDILTGGGLEGLTMRGLCLFDKLFN